MLNESQLGALEKAETDKEAHGEFESECSRYCRAHDTFRVGTLKGGGRVYLQTFLDAYSKVAFAKLYDRKTPLVAVLNDRIAASLMSMGVAQPDSDRPLHRVLRRARAARVRSGPATPDRQAVLRYSRSLDPAALHESLLLGRDELPRAGQPVPL